MSSSYNARCPAVKRLLKEAQELHESTEEYFAQPLEDNLFEWHFTVRGPPETEFQGGVYHGRIIMPAEYPMKPPNIIFLTANGRFETNKKICLSISGHHPETWQPSWSIRTALLAIIGFMPTPANGTLGALEYTKAERVSLSRKSAEYVCPECGRVAELLKKRTGNNTALQEEAKKVSAQMVVTEKKEVFFDEKSDDSSESSLSKSVKEPHYSSKESVSPSADEIENHSENDSTPQQTPTTSSCVRPLFTSPSPELIPNSPSDPRHRRSLSQSGGVANDILLSAALLIIIALFLRRLYLIEADSFEGIEEILW